LDFSFAIGTAMHKFSPGLFHSPPISYGHHLSKPVSTNIATGSRKMTFCIPMLIKWEMDFSLPFDTQCTAFRRECFIRLLLVTGTTWIRLFWLKLQPEVVKWHFAFPYKSNGKSIFRCRVNGTARILRRDSFIRRLLVTGTASHRQFRQKLQLEVAKWHFAFPC
jgi:hypothetical protein